MGPLVLPLEATVPAIFLLVLIVPKNCHPIVVNFRQVRHPAAEGPGGTASLSHGGNAGAGTNHTVRSNMPQSS
jgi:hypothetical protein